MGALRDPKLEKFALALFGNIVAGMKRSAAADAAAEAAGYTGRSRAANARKRANRADVKRRLDELLAPSLAKAGQQAEATLEWATQKLTGIAEPDLSDEVKVTDQIAAITLLAKIKGWMAPEKRDVTVRDANQMSDDELARIAAGSGEGPPTAAGNPA